MQEVLDIPVGTGRFVERLRDRGLAVVGVDISAEMMEVARGKVSGREAPFVAFTRAEGEALPFRDGAFNCVMTIRFLFHLTRQVRVAFLRECARVSRRWVIADYRHRRSLRYLKRVALHRLGFGAPPPPRVSRSGMEEELRDAGLRVETIFRIAPLFSDKWVVLCQRI